MKKANVKMSWREIGKELNKEHKTIKRYAISYAMKKEDLEFATEVA